MELLAVSFYALYLAPSDFCRGCTENDTRRKSAFQSGAPTRGCLHMRSLRSATRLPDPRRIASSLALLGVLALTWSSGAAASTIAPLPESDYATRNACQAPEPGHVSCLALVLVAKTAAARAHTHPLGMFRRAPIAAGKAAEGAFGLRPEDLQGAYFPGETPMHPPTNHRRSRSLTPTTTPTPKTT